MGYEKIGTNVHVTIVHFFLVFDSFLFIQNTVKDCGIKDTSPAASRLAPERAAFFFVIVISHIDLRNTLEIEMVTYLEYLYFIVYIYVLMVTVNALFFSSTKDYLFVDYIIITCLNYYSGRYLCFAVYLLRLCCFID